MTLAFYAPMKPPDHPVPSGDRTIARALLAALRQSGAAVEVVSALQTRDGTGDADRQVTLLAEADAEAQRLLALPQSSDWTAWITYHNYYKAPDLLGPVIAKARKIPYIQIESTRARKRLTGPWARFAAAAEAATDAADAVFYFSLRDSEALLRDAPEGQEVVHLKPYLPISSLPPQSTREGPMLSVGMMRHGDKLASYEIIAQTLALLETDDWQLSIVGDGPARGEVADLMAPFGRKVAFLGALDQAGLADAYAYAKLLFWPGVNEALGQVYLEAQAAGVPVVAQDRPGMRDVLAPGIYPTPEAGPTALARRIDALLAGTHEAEQAANAARNHISAHHLMDQAAAHLTATLQSLGVAL